MIKSAFPSYDVEKLIKLLQHQFISLERRHYEEMIELQRRRKDQTKLLPEKMIANRLKNPEAQVAIITQVAAILILLPLIFL